MLLAMVSYTDLSVSLRALTICRCTAGIRRAKRNIACLMRVGRSNDKPDRVFRLTPHAFETLPSSCPNRNRYKPMLIAVATEVMATSCSGVNDLSNC